MLSGVIKRLRTGFEPLAWAEYCLETGDLDGAGRYARKAIFKAKPWISSYYYLRPVYPGQDVAARGQFLAARSVLNSLSVMVAEYNNPVFDNTLSCV